MTMTAIITHPPLWQRTLLFQLWEDFCTRWKFKFTLPQISVVTLEGVKLDVSSLSPIMKNNLMLGRYEVQERTLIERHLKASDVVLEVGGAIGFIGLFCQTRLGITNYTTVEANPHTANLLRKNYALNGRTPRLFNCALAGADGVVTLNVGGDFWENSLVTGAGGESTVQVPALCFRSLLAQLDETPTALIVDIEGAEQFVEFNEVPTTVKKVLIELHPSIIGHAATYRIVAHLINLGFQVEEQMAGTFLFLRS
jgi:FkbM family methyltransferase